MIIGGVTRSKSKGYFFFFVLFVSFAARDAVYMNRVIIPDEKVRIITSGIHLLVRVLYR
jgi:hypothetical protein